MKARHIKTRIRIAMAALGAGFLAFLLLVLWTGLQTERHMGIASGSLFPATLSSQEASSNFQKLTKAYSDAVLLQDKAALNRADESAQAVTNNLRSVQQYLTFDPQRQKQVSDLIDRFADLTARSRATYSAMVDASAATTDQTQSQNNMATLAKENKQTETDLQQLRGTLTGDFQAQLDSIASWTNRQRAFGVILFVIVASCAVVFSVLVERQVSVPLYRLTSRLKDIAEGEGDLTQRIPISSQDEIGELSHWFNTFIDKLQGIMRQVKINTVELTSACHNLTASSAEMAKGAESQQGQTSLMAAAMHEMSATVMEISQNSNQAAQRTQQAAEDARDGGKVVEQTIRMMNNVTASVDQIAKQIADLGSRSKEIGRIVGVINEIAEQTNLLALNAAIEAARAGEHGRGFAVVAGEVRSLAERTSKSTQEIAAMIGNIQKETLAAVQAMEHGTAEVQQGATVTSEAGMILGRIIESANHAAEMVMQIATAATQQSSTTDQVNQTINEIDKISHDFTSGAQYSAQSAESLSNLATALQSLVSRFKVGEEQNTELSRNLTSISTKLTRSTMRHNPQRPMAVR